MRAGSNKIFNVALPRTCLPTPELDYGQPSQEAPKNIHDQPTDG